MQNHLPRTGLVGMIVAAIIVITSVGLYGQEIWCDDFEGYANGSWSSVWYGSGNSSTTVVDNSTSYDGEYSIRMFGVIGSCWGTILTRPLGTTFPMTIELAVRNGSESVYGCHPFRASFGLKPGPHWSAVPEISLFTFLPNGDLMIDFINPHPVLEGFDLNTWYKIRIELDSPGDGSIHARYWIDDNLVGEYSRPWEEWMGNVAYAALGAQEGTVWFDDVCVRAGVSTSTPVFCDIKPGSCPNSLNVKPYRTEELETSNSFAKLVTDVDRKPKAVLPVAIMGTADFDVSEIDPTTLMLEGVPALRWSMEDVGTPVSPDANECECNELGGDGFIDLTLKFDKEAIVDALGEVYDGDEIALTITGQLYDGTEIEGMDCAVIKADDELGGIFTRPTEVPEIFALNQNHPNPFNPETEISYSIANAGHVTLDIYNIVGQKVAALVNGYQDAGSYTVTWNSKGFDGNRVSSGIYLYRLTAGEFVQTRKMILMK